MEELIEVWGKTYYIKPILLASILFAILIGAKFFKRESIYLHFMFYAIINFLLLTVLDTDINKKGIPARQNTLIIETENTLIELIEFGVFYKFFLNVLRMKIAKQLMTISIIPFLSLSIIFFIQITRPEFSRNQIRSFSYTINVIELFLLLFPCLIFFYELFTKEASQVLVKSPSFWITTGLFFYCIVSLPFLLIGADLAVNNRELYNLMFAIHYTSLAFVFLSIAKAFQCKKPLTT